MGPRARGIDVSHHNPVKDWTKLAVSSPSPEQILFMGIKASEGATFIDPLVRAHRAGFRTSGMHLGIYYHFARSGDPKQQAERLMDVVGELQPRERLCLDLEVAPAITPRGALNWVDAFYTSLLGGTCKAHRPLIYTSARVWREVCGDLAWDLAPEIDLWLPRYNTQGLEPKIPKPWAGKNWTIWQWSDGETPPYSAPGVGHCDANVFQGDQAALEAYVKGSLKNVDSGPVLVG